MIVVDASAVVSLLAWRDCDSELSRRLGDASLHAPHLIDVEVQNALQRMLRRAEIGADVATDTRRDHASLSIRRYEHRDLLDRAWQLRHNATTYDAIYLALAEALEAPLVTCDTRLAEVPGVDATVEVFAPGEG